MSSRRIYLTAAIPYVNGAPHLGHALELVQADVLARRLRARGDAVRFLTGTDENAIKNVLAAEAAGVGVADLVERNSRRFEALQAALRISNDDFIRTSADPRHPPGVERLWRACAAAGDLYEREYEGLYCAGCESFVDRPCSEHAAPPERVAERNWFFRLSRYRDELLALVERGTLRIEPARRRNEVLALLRAGLEDVSVSRPAARARGWGIPVPGDPSQVVYVWFDALANYVTALGYGTDGELYRTWWSEADERLHVIGKGILRFHAVYWPAFLLSAGEPAPTTVFVHDYVTAGGGKLSKSTGGSVSPLELVDAFGADAVRWWLLRDGPDTRDAELTLDGLGTRANELADRIGNLVARTVALGGRVDAPAATPADDAVERFDFRGAAAAVLAAADCANRLATHTRPWTLPPEQAAPLVDELAARCSALAASLRPLLPDAAARIEAALERSDRAAARTLFRKVA
jgi:methionyl-tRNA synthetase